MIFRNQTQTNAWHGINKCRNHIHYLGTIYSESLNSNLVLIHILLFSSRLKAGNFCFKLNNEGSTAVELLGVDYKRTIKPVQLSLLDETKKSSKESLEDLAALQQQLRELSSQIDDKQNGNALLLAKIEKVYCLCSSCFLKLIGIRDSLYSMSCFKLRHFWSLLLKVPSNPRWSLWWISQGLGDIPDK